MRVQILKDNLKRISNQKFMLDLLNRNIKRIIPQAKIIREIKIKTIKFNQIVKGKEQLTVKYITEYVDEENITQVKIMVGKAHRTGDREKTYYIRKYIWEKYFYKTKRYTTSRPLAYYPFLGLMLYEWVEGVTLLDLLNSKLSLSKEKELVKGAALFLRKLHRIKPSPSLLRRLELRDRNKKTLTPLTKRIKFEELLKTNRKMYQQTQEIIKTFDDWKKCYKFKPTIIHGDFQPGHILFNNNFIVIDWDASHINNPLIDLASFCFYLENNVRNLTAKRKKDLSTFFIKRYFNNRNYKRYMRIIKLNQIPFILNAVDYYSFLKNFKEVNKIVKRGWDILNKNL